MTDAMDLADRVVLVTGAGQGIGREIALHAARHGARGVVVNDYFEDRAIDAAEEIAATGSEALPVQADVTDIVEVGAMVGEATDAFGVVDVLVNNAGNDGPNSGSAETPFWESDPADWDPWLRVNLHGVMNCSRQVLPGMIEQEHGRILTVISDAGRVGEPHLVVYSGAKAGAAGFTRALAKAVGRYAITVNAIALGVTRTPSTEGFLEEEERLEKILRHYAIRRVGRPSDVANLAVFLASEAGSWITGQTYPVNGGYSFAM